MKNEEQHLLFLEKFNFSFQLNVLKKKLKNKTVLLYGAGEFFAVINKHYDLSELNIIGIVDRKFKSSAEETFCGYKTYTPEEMFNIKADFVLLTTKFYIDVIFNLINESPKSYKIKFLPILKRKNIELFKENIPFTSFKGIYYACETFFAYKMYEIFNLTFLIKKLELLSSMYSSHVKKRFKLDKVQKKSVLIIEVNNCHGETLPSLCKYFNDLEYNVDVIISPSLNRTCPINYKLLKSLNIKKYVLKHSDIKECLNESKINNYEYIFFNSYNFYCVKDCNCASDLLPKAYTKENILTYAHHIENFKDFEKFKPFILADLPNNIKAKMINPHYFGKIKIYKKNKRTNFIAIGGIEPHRRNHNLLINAVNELYQKGLTNFKITIIGKGDLNNVPKHIKKFFDIKGRLTYPHMFKEMQKADYFLPLLDPTNPEHDRYITVGTSGSFQLIYGFLTPCLIQEKFAKIHGFDTNNSFIYKTNEDLKDNMIKAINLSQSDYIKLQNNIKIFAETLYKKSIENLKNL